MRRPGPLLACALLPFALVLSAPAARAEEAAVPIRVDYTTLPDCPSSAELVESVLARTPRARRAEPGEEARTFVVALTRHDEASEGRLVVRLAGGAESEREVAGDTCAEVADALAFMIALSIDPNASARALPRPTPPEPPASSPPPAVLEETVPRPRPRSREGWRLAASADASLAAGIAPAWVLGVPVMIHAVGPGRGMLAPSLHLGFERGTSGSVDVGAAAARFTWTVGIVEACPTGVRTRALRVEPCARVEAGAVQGQGSHIAPTRTDTRASVALGPAARAEWTFAAPLFIEVEAGARFPLGRPTYFFQPSTIIYRVPAVAGFVGAGVGARFL